MVRDLAAAPAAGHSLCLFARRPTVGYLMRMELRTALRILSKACAASSYLVKDTIDPALLSRYTTLNSEPLALISNT